MGYHMAFVLLAPGWVVAVEFDVAHVTSNQVVEVSEGRGCHLQHITPVNEGLLSQC